MGFDEVILDAFLIIIGKAPFLFGFLGAAPLIWIAAGAIIHALSTKKHTVLNELTALGTPRTGGKIKGTAVVAGGGGTGMLTARVLSDHFEEVVVVEANRPDAERKSWYDPGYTQPIVLSVLRRLFPAIDAALARAGLRVGPFNPSFSLSGHELRAPDYLLPPTIYGSRSGLERVVNELTKKEFPNVTIAQGRITGLAADPTHTSIDSATLSLGPATSSQIPLKLFVDATGSAAAGAGWLAAVAPAWQVARESYDPQVIGVSTVVPVPDAAAGLAGTDVGIIRQSASAGKYYSISRLEDGNIRLFASQRGGPPTSLPNSFTSFLTWCTTVGGPSSRSSDTTSIAALLTGLQAASTAEPTWSAQASDGVAYAIWYDAAPGALPANFVALGSALVRPNALYAPAASAALQVAALDGVLRSTALAPGEGLPDNFTRVAAAAIASRMRPVWQLAKAIDYGFEQTQPVGGKSLRDGAWLRRYAKALAGVASEDDNAAARVWGVLGGTSPLSSVLHPVLFAKVLWRGLRGGAARKV